MKRLFDVAREHGQLLDVQRLGISGCMERV